MLQITRADAEKLLKRAQGAGQAIKRARERADEVVGTVVQTTEIGTAAFGFGLVNGRWGGVEVLGVPLDLLAAGGLHVLGFVGVASDHLHNFGDGALASFATTLGRGVGIEMAQKAAQQPNQLPAGAAAGYAGRLSREELQRLANAA